MPSPKSIGDLVDQTTLAKAEGAAYIATPSD
jgi:hypothetical protein